MKIPKVPKVKVKYRSHTPPPSKIHKDRRRQPRSKGKVELKTEY